jgi:[ribosomal protein S18]-alanine N-acetyltransferase
MGITASWHGVACHVRWCIRRDLPEILAIEQASYDSPWTLADFAAVLGWRGVIGMVAGRGGAVVGYVLYESCRRRLEVLNLAVDPGSRRRGVGSALLLTLAARLGGRRQALGLWVADENLPAQLFLRAAGFRCIAVEEDDYRLVYTAPVAAPERVPCIRD